MSCIFLQVGQCGNQVGSEFWRLLANQCNQSSSYSSFSSSTTSSSFLAPPSVYNGLFTTESVRNGASPRHKARCILIDSEPKVIRNVLEDGAITTSSSSPFRAENAIYEQSGRGNNWAMGYCGGIRNEDFRSSSSSSSTTSNELRSKNKLLMQAMDLLRREAERTDYFSGCVLMHSLSGGTGSGLGSRIIEEIRDAYGSSRYILAVSIAPYSQGESPLQNYNAILTLNHLQQYADGVLLFQNDDISTCLSKQQSQASSISTEDLNKYIASCLAGIFMPMKTERGWRSFDMQSLISSVFPMPQTKFAEVRTLPFIEKAKRSKVVSGGGSGNSTLSTLEFIAEGLIKLVPKYDINNQIIRSIMSQVYVRGDVGSAFLQQQQQQHHKQRSLTHILDQAYSHVSWNPSPFDLKVSYAPAYSSAAASSSSSSGTTTTTNSNSNVSNIQVSLTVCSNRANVVPLFDGILQRAHLQRQSAAYFHWYRRYGCTDEYFQECFENVYDIIASYEEMCNK